MPQAQARCGLQDSLDIIHAGNPRPRVIQEPIVDALDDLAHDSDWESGSQKKAENTRVNMLTFEFACCLMVR